MRDEPGRWIWVAWRRATLAIGGGSNNAVIETRTGGTAQGMNSRAPPFLVAMSTIGCATQQHTGDASAAASWSAKDEAAMRATLVGVDAAWNAHDMDGLHEQFAADAQWVRSSGNIWRSRDRIYVHYEFGPRSPRLRTENIEVRPIAQQVAVAVAIMKYSGGEIASVGEVAATHLRVSVVTVQRAGAWRILQLHEAGILPVVEDNDELWGKAGGMHAGQGTR